MSDVSKIVLAYCLQDQSNLIYCRDTIKHFYFESKVGKIYEIVCDIYRKFEKLPTLSVFSKTLDARNLDPEEQQDLEDIFEEALDEALDQQEFEYYLNELKTQYTRRIWEEAWSGTTSEDGKVVSGIEELIKKDPKKAYERFKESIALHMEDLENEGSSNCASLDETIEKYLSNYKERAENPEKAYGVRMGYDFLDQQCLGMHAGELFLIGGRHGSGKSVFILNVGVNAYRAGKNVLIISIEMPREQYEQRFYACYCDIPFNGIRAGTLTQEQLDVMIDATKQVVQERKSNNHYFHIADITNVSAFTVEAEFKKATIKYGVKPDLIIVDYLGIMKSIDNSDSDWQQMLAIAVELRALSRNKNIPILSAVQLNRDKNKGKGTDRIGRSDGVGATCDVFLQIEEKPEEDSEDNNKKTIALDLDDVISIFIGKMRNGESGRSFSLYKKFANMIIKNKGVYLPREEEVVQSFSGAEIDINDQPDLTPRQENAEDQDSQQKGEFIAPQ